MPDTARLRVDLQVAREAISGSVESPFGGPTTFDGWLGLISIVERIQANLLRPGARGMNAPELPPDDDQVGPADEPERGPS